MNLWLMFEVVAFVVCVIVLICGIAVLIKEWVDSGEKIELEIRRHQMEEIAREMIKEWESAQIQREINAIHEATTKADDETDK